MEINGAGLSHGNVHVDLLGGIVGEAGLHYVFTHLDACENIVALCIGGLGDTCLVTDGSHLNAFQRAVALIGVIDDAGDATRGIYRIRLHAACRNASRSNNTKEFWNLISVSMLY